MIKTIIELMMNAGLPQQKKKCMNKKSAVHPKSSSSLTSPHILFPSSSLHVFLKSTHAQQAKQANSKCEENIYNPRERKNE